jgi:hypothetical protein
MRISLQKAVLVAGALCAGFHIGCEKDNGGSDGSGGAGGGGAGGDTGGGGEGGEGGAGPGSGECTPDEGSAMCPMSIQAGMSAEFFGTHLGNAHVAFTDEAGQTIEADPNFGDDQSIDVTVPEGLTAGPVTVRIYIGECFVECTTVLE